MRGISPNQPCFEKICLENISEFRCLRTNSLREQSREFFCQRRELIRRAGNEQGIWRKTDPRAPTHLMASKYFGEVEMKIINSVIARADEHAWLLRTGLPRMRVSRPGSNPQTSMTRLKRSVQLWASPEATTPYAESRIPRKGDPFPPSRGKAARQRRPHFRNVNAPFDATNVRQADRCQP
jgi:hypothetical protein